MLIPSDDLQQTVYHGFTDKLGCQPTCFSPHSDGTGEQKFGCSLRDPRIEGKKILYQKDPREIAAS